MSEVQEVQQEETANPYNMRKDYGGEQDAPFQSADGIYHKHLVRPPLKQPLMKKTLIIKSDTMI